PPARALFRQPPEYSLRAIDRPATPSLPVSIHPWFTGSLPAIRLKIDALDAMVLAIEDMNPTFAVNGQSPWTVELPRQSPGSSPTSERLTGGGKFLHSMIALLEDIENAFAVEREII